MTKVQREKLSAETVSGVSRIPNFILLGIEFLVLLAILGVAWRERSVMPLVPTADPDSWGYLNPALCWLGGLGLQQTGGRDWLYPAFLAVFLKTTGSFAGIVLWQRFLGISSGVLMAVTWRCWVSTLPFHRRIRYLVLLVGVPVILAQLMNPQSVAFEMAIRPEAVMSFFIYAQLGCLMGYYKYRWQTPKALPSALLGAAAIVLSYTCLLLKPSWLLAFVITSTPVVAGIFGRALSWKTRVLAPALGIVFSFLLLWLPGAVYLIKDSGSVTFLPSTLFTIHARLIDRALEAKVARMRESDPKRAKLRVLVDVLENELRIAEKRPGAYETLGYDADYLLYSSPLIPAVYSYTGNDDKKFRAFCFSCYMDAALYDPWAFLRKIAHQFTEFLLPKPDTFFRKHNDFGAFYQESLVMNQDLPEGIRTDVRDMLLRYRADLVAQTGTSLKLNGPSLLRRFCYAFVPLTLPLEILFLAAFFSSLFWPPLRELRLGGWAAFSLFSAPLGNAVTLCVVHSLAMDRYRYTYGGILLFALVAMTVFASFVIALSLRPSD